MWEHYLKAKAPCQVKLLLLPNCVPSHNFFRNFFAKNFVDSIIIVTFAVSYPYWKLQLGEGGMDNIYIKGVTVRFGFDAIRTSQLPNVCQEQSNGNAPRVYCIYALIVITCLLLVMQLVIPYTYIYVGLSALLVSTDRAMRRPTNRGTSDSLAPRFVYI